MELQNKIHTYFKTFLKIKENMKIACQRKWQQILLKMEGFLEPKNSKDEKKCGVGII